MIYQAFTRILYKGLFLKPMMPLGAWYLRSSPRMITCREFNDFIFDYTEGRLTKKQEKLFKLHMKLCPMCRNFLKSYMTAIKAGKEIFPFSDMEVPADVPADLLEAIRDVSDNKEGH